MPSSKNKRNSDDFQIPDVPPASSSSSSENDDDQNKQQQQPIRKPCPPSSFFLISVNGCLCQVQNEFGRIRPDEIFAPYILLKKKNTMKRKNDEDESSSSDDDSSASSSDDGQNEEEQEEDIIKLPNGIDGSILVHPNEEFVTVRFEGSCLMEANNNKNNNCFIEERLLLPFPGRELLSSSDENNNMMKTISGKLVPDLRMQDSIYKAQKFANELEDDIDTQPHPQASSGKKSNNNKNTNNPDDEFFIIYINGSICKIFDEEFARIIPDQLFGPYILLKNAMTNVILLPNPIDGTVRVERGAAYVTLRFDTSSMVECDFSSKLDNKKGRVVENSAPSIVIPQMTVQAAIHDAEKFANEVEKNQNVRNNNSGGIESSHVVKQAQLDFIDAERIKEVERLVNFVKGK